MNAQIRERTAADLEACVRLARLVHDQDGYPPHLPRGLEDFLDSPDALAAWVAVAGDGLVGHVALHRRSSSAVMDLAAAATHEAADDLAVIARLLVAPAARRSGVGRALLARAEAGARDRGMRPVLDVALRFGGAIALYEACGWVRLGTTTTHFRDGGSLKEAVYVGPPTAR